MRERHFMQLDVEFRAGITPARAGKTLCTTCCSTSCWDHPRSCGKDLRKAFRRLANGGSPPLVRERHALLNGDEYVPRITPARAGKTIKLYFGLCQVKDHPRSCGKDLLNVWCGRTGRGSPPLVRERRRYLQRRKRWHGITPARAGKTLASQTP